MSDPIDSLDEMRRQLARAAGRRDWTALIDQARRMRAAYPQSEDADYYEARGLIESGHYEDADHILLLGMDRFPRNPMLAVLYGESATRGMGQDAAIDRWQSILLRLPEVPNVYLGLAHAYRAAGRHGEADRVIANGLERLSDNPDLLVNRAQAAWDAKDWAASLRDWTAVRRIDPRRPDAQTFMIRNLAHLGRVAEADELAREGMKERPADVELAVSYAMTANRVHKSPEAPARWRRVLAIAPTHLFANLGLARALAALDRFDDADAALQEGLKHHPDNDILLKEAATIAEKRAGPEPTVESLKAIYEQQPPKAETYLGYANALEQAGDPAKAEEIVAEGVGFAPRHRGLLIKYAALAAVNGDPGEAVTRYQAADRLFPDVPAIKRGLQQAERALAKEQRRIEIEQNVTADRKKSSTIRAPEVPAATRVPQVGPTALDLLLSGKDPGTLAIVHKPARASTGFGGLLRRVLRRE